MDRLPAEELEQAVFESLVATYPNTGLIAAAIIKSRRRDEALLPKQRDELATLEKEIRKSEEASLRGKDPSGSSVRARVRSLGEKLGKLQARRQKVIYSLESHPEVYEPTRKELGSWRRRMVEIMDCGTPSQKAMFQSLIHRIFVEGRHNILPTLRLAGPNM